MPVAREVDEVEGRSDQKGLNVPRRQLVLETLYRFTVPLQRKTIVGGGFRRPLLTRRRFKKQGFKKLFRPCFLVSPLTKPKSVLFSTPLYVISQKER